MRGATVKCDDDRIDRHISIHAPHAGRDAPRSNRINHTVRFQSTRPMRGATHTHFGDGDFLFISIHAPHAGRDRAVHQAFRRLVISIHAPHAGRDSKSEQIALHIFAKKAWIPDIFAQNAAFQSVLPLADRQKLLYLRCEPLRKSLRAFASHYKIIGSSGR